MGTSQAFMEGCLIYVEDSAADRGDSSSFQEEPSSDDACGGRYY